MERTNINILVTYSINCNDQNGEHTTIHTTIIEFEGLLANHWDASFIMTKIISKVRTKNPDIKDEQVALINFWVI